VPALSDDEAEFLRQYEANHADLKGLTELAAQYIEELLESGQFDVAVVQARAKSPDSVRMKLLEKRYPKPTVQMTDQIGVRIITYYGERVNDIVSRLREGLRIDGGNSSDKRLELGQAEFGYRSVHLVAKLPHRAMRDGRFRPLRDRSIEVQVRSLLDHAWAEIEHEIVYKSGVEFSDDFRREFASLAGTLELLERAFLGLRDAQDGLVESYRNDFANGRRKGEVLDSARLLGLLEWKLPEGKGWRKALRLGDPFEPHMERACIRALAEVDIMTAAQLLALFRRQGFQSILAGYASVLGISPQEASHLAVAALAVGYKDPAVFQAFFPSLAITPAFQAVFPQPGNAAAK
jgi:ppGpp synthetase/RelA/SpoT-type nucleotidyltranferase